jgi:hypothetical protein
VSAERRFLDVVRADPTVTAVLQRETETARRTAAGADARTAGSRRCPWVGVGRLPAR